MSLEQQRWVAYISGEKKRLEREEILRFLAVLENYTPWIEHRGGCGAYLELGGARRLLGHPFEVLSRLQGELARSGLRTSSGLGANKLFSLAAADIAETGEVFWVLPQGEREFLDRMQVGRWLEMETTRRTRTMDDRPLLASQAKDLDARSKTPNGMIEQMRGLGIERVGDLAAVDPAWVKRVWGEWGLALRQQALGFDPRPVVRLLPGSEDNVFQPGLFLPEGKEEKLSILIRVAAFLQKKYGRDAAQISQKSEGRSKK
jgi:nucleotidyltransferase/DNA polymerase involved in DNA repair